MRSANERVCNSLERFRSGKVFCLHYGCDIVIWVDVMAAWLIAGVGIVYFIVAVDLFIRGNIGLGIAFVGYCIGNVGLYLAAKGG